LKPGEWLDWTPGELAAQADAYDTRTIDRYWKPPAWLADQIPTQVWAPNKVKRGVFPFDQLYPPAKPKTPEQEYAMWERFSRGTTDAERGH
jgi:hypothetical protein